MIRCLKKIYMMMIMTNISNRTISYSEQKLTCITGRLQNNLSNSYGIFVSLYSGTSNEKENRVVIFIAEKQQKL